MAKISNNGNDSKVPTQGSLNDIIAAMNQMPKFASLMDSVVKIITKNKRLSDPNTAKSIVNYTTIVNSVLGKNGLVMSIATAVKTLKPHTKDLTSSIAMVSESLEKLTDKKAGKLNKRINIFKSNLDAIHIITDYIANKKFDSKAITGAKKNLEVISGMFTTINEMFTIITSMKVPKLLFIKFFFLKLAMTQVMMVTFFIAGMVVMLPFIWIGIVVVKSLSIFFNILKTLFDTINEISANPLTMLKLFMINLIMPLMTPIIVSSLISGVLALVASPFITPLLIYWKKIQLVFTSIKKAPVNPFMIPKLMMMMQILMISNTIVAYGLVMGFALTYLKKFGASLSPFAEVAIVFWTIRKIFENIRATKVGLFTRIKLKMILNCMRLVVKILIQMAMMFIPPTVIIQILLVAWMFKAIKNMFINILIAAPFAILAIPAMLIMTLAFLLLKPVLKLFCWAIDGLTSPTLATNLLQLLLITGALTLIALMFFVLALVAIKVVKSILWIIALLASITLVVMMLVGIGMLFSIMGPAIGIAVGGLTMMLTVVSILLAMSLLLRAVQALDLDADKIKENVRTVIDSTKEVINAIFEGNYKKSGESNDSGFMSILKGIGGTVALHAKTILSIPFLSTALVSITFVTMLARKLRKIQKFDLNRDAVINGVNVVIDTAKHVSEAIGGDLSSTKQERKKTRSGKRLLKIVKRAIKVIVDIAEKLNSIQKIELDESLIKAKVLSIFKVVADVDTMMEQLNSKTPIDPNNSPMKILSLKERREKKRAMRQNAKVLSKVDKVINTLNDIGGSLFSISELKMDDKFKDAITNNVRKMFEFINELESHIALFMIKDKNSEDIVDAQKMTKKEWKQANKKLSKVESTIATIHGICDALNGVKELKFNQQTKDTIKTNVELALGSIESIAAIITGSSDKIKIDEDDIEALDPLLKYIRTINDGFKDMANVEPSRLEQNIGNYIKFVDSVNTMDVEKVQKTTQMFEKMSQFSSSIQGDFDRLAESLSSKLLPVLEELKSVMSDIPEKLDKGFQDTSASIAATSSAPTSENVAAQVQRENPNLSKEEVDKIVKRRMSDRAKSDANGIGGKLDTLIGLLKGTTGTAFVKLK